MTSKAHCAHQYTAITSFFLLFASWFATFDLYFVLENHVHSFISLLYLSGFVIRQKFTKPRHYQLHVNILSITQNTIFFFLLLLSQPVGICTFSYIWGHRTSTTMKRRQQKQNYATLCIIKLHKNEHKYK